MRHIRILGLCLAAALAVVAYAVSSASALPEWGECVSKAGGKYLDSNCTKKASLKNPGSFEWKKGKELPAHKFTGHNVGSGGILSTALFLCEEEEPVGSGKSGPNFGRRLPRSACKNGLEDSRSTAAEIECKSEENSGEAVSTKSIANVHVVFKGCILLGALPCTGAGLAEGEVATNTLKGELGYISKSKHEVGVRLTPAKAKGKFAEFRCVGGTINNLLIQVGVGNEKEGAAYTPEKTGGNDAIISPITPVNAMSSTFTQVYTVNKETTENIPNKFEGKPISLLEDNNEQTAEGEHEQSDWSPAGEEITNVNTPEVPGEIKG